MRLRRADLRRATLEQLAPAAIQDTHHEPQEVQHRDRLYRRSLAFSDVCATVLAFAVAAALGPRPSLAVLLVVAFVVGVNKAQGLYDRDELLLRKTTIDDAPKLFHNATLVALVAWLGSGLFFTGTLHADQVLVLWGVGFAASLVGRRFSRGIVRHRVTVERCLFIGDAGSFQRLKIKLAQADVKAELVSRMTFQRTGRRGERAAQERELGELLRWARIHRVIIEPQALPPEDALDLVRCAKGLGVRVSLLPRVLDVVGSSVVFDQLDGMTVLGVRRFGLTRSSKIAKRTFDLVGAGLLLLAVAPLMAIVAIAIRLDSRGPVFFRQTRVGRDGHHFRIFKFRTMVVDAEHLKAHLRHRNEVGDGKLFKIADDPRITRVGRLLRKTSLDELPQLFNVVLGDMSLVGPRPLIVEEDDHIQGLDRRSRLALTPGMTGQWQIAGSARVPMQEMVKIDYLYVAGWSLWEDLKILLRTVPYVVARRGM